MNLDEPIRKEPLSLYRGIAHLKYPGMPYFRDIDAAVEYIFNEPYPPLVSPVADRFNEEEAYRRFREACLKNDGSLPSMVRDHYRGDRDLSYLVSASTELEQAVFFAGNTVRNNPFGLVVRFTRNHDYEPFAPADHLNKYSEVLVAARVEPPEIDKILVVGCRKPNQMLIEILYKRHKNGRVRKYRNPDHLEYTYLRDVKWNRDRFFEPPLASPIQK